MHHNSKSMVMKKGAQDCSCLQLNKIRHFTGWQENIPQNTLIVLYLCKFYYFLNVMDLDAININRHDFIFNFCWWTAYKNVASKTYKFSDFTLNTDDASTISGRKRKQCWINRCRSKIMNICSDFEKSVCGSCSNKVIKLSVCRDYKKE